MGKDTGPRGVGPAHSHNEPMAELSRGRGSPDSARLCQHMSSKKVKTRPVAGGLLCASAKHITLNPKNNPMRQVPLSSLPSLVQVKKPEAWRGYENAQSHTRK